DEGPGRRSNLTGHATYSLQSARAGLLLISQPGAAVNRSAQASTNTSLQHHGRVWLRVIVRQELRQVPQSASRVVKKSELAAPSVEPDNQRQRSALRLRLRVERSRHRKPDSF